MLAVVLNKEQRVMAVAMVMGCSFIFAATACGGVCVCTRALPGHVMAKDLREREK